MNGMVSSFIGVNGGLCDYHQMLQWKNGRYFAKKIPLLVNSVAFNKLVMRSNLISCKCRIDSFQF